MAYNEKLANRVREALALFPTLDEQLLPGGLSFLIDGKLVVQVQEDELLLRCLNGLTDELSSRPGARACARKGKGVIQGWLLVDEVGTRRQADFVEWLTVALAATATTKARRK
jgi:hypothetical protein